METFLTTPIDLKVLPIVCSSCSKYRDRQERIQQSLKMIGREDVTVVEGPIETPYTIGVAKGIKEAISLNSPPFLLLEDDSELLIGNYQSLVEVPNDCDALYLGTSWFGMLNGQTTFKGIISCDYTPNLLKVFNMLSFHAIVFNSQRYVDFFHEELDSFIKNPIGGCDDPIAKKMKYYNVYAVKKPMFYQADNHSEMVTRTPLNPLF